MLAAISQKVSTGLERKSSCSQRSLTQSCSSSMRRATSP